jgi:hypothetical protein
MPANEVDAEGWLRSNIILRLTPLEAGALHGFLDQWRKEHPDNFKVRVKGRLGETEVTARLIEKLEFAQQEYWSHESDIDVSNISDFTPAIKELADKLGIVP